MNVDNTQTPKKTNVLSLCTGYGGIERGLKLAGFKHRVVTHVEIEAFAIANLVDKMEAGKMGWAPIWTDLKTLPLEPFRGKIGLVTGGYPCQPFSAAGRRKGKEDPRHLWPHICRIIDGTMPRMCFFENVEGHITLGLRQVLADLESRGYKTTWGIFSATEVGAPHQRKRVFILANSDSVNGRSSAEGRDYHTKIRPASENVGDTASDNERGLRKTRKKSPETFRGSSTGLADPTGERSQNRRGKPSQQSGSESKPQRLRTAADSDSTGRIEQCGTESIQTKQQASERYSRWPVEPQLGRVVNGCPDRVDRLRLLGNGVVPQTVAKAFITLKKELGI